MAYRKYLLIILLLSRVFGSEAQMVQSLRQVDSAANVLYNAGDWKQLIILGERSINSGIDFPVLLQQLGYAYFITGNYSKALTAYNNVLSNDSYNQTARYYAYLCHKYVNHDLQASYYAAHLDTNQLKDEKIGPFSLINAGIESGFKQPDDSYRSGAFYSRFSLTNRVSWRLMLEQSFIFFGQSISDKLLDAYRDRDARPVTISNYDQQFEYFAKLSYAVTGKMVLVGAYHYLNTNFQNITYNSNVGLVGLKYSGTYIDLQADFNWSYMIDRHLRQYNAGLLFYPLGNLDFYTISRISSLEQNNANQIIFNQSLGFNLIRNVWLETSATFGNLDNYIDADGLYIYNTIDASKLKLGETVFYEIGKHAQLQLNYTFEKKQDVTHNLNYNQHSATAGVLWKF